ncbi:hypothetical protein QQ054_31925 [Oscillatoria amoena NRMC-F 0135]|nr:hypothetical protein [Oscillatoria amoena NRMC-F 0135]
MTIEVSWQDIPQDGCVSVTVPNKESGVLRVLKIESDAIKNILIRFIDQRFNALERNPSATSLKHSINILKKKNTLGDLTTWVRQNEAKLLIILPSTSSKQHRWRELIHQVIEFSATYKYGKGRYMAIQQLNQYYHYATNH